MTIQLQGSVSVPVSAARRSNQAMGGTDWGTLPVRERLLVLRRFRHLAATQYEDLLEAFPVGLQRTSADSLAAEILPLLAACSFLERKAAAILKPRTLRGGRPFWLSGVTSSVERVPFGTVLLIGPANYPLFLPGVQALQALAAGNRVLWKPGRGGARIACAIAGMLRDAGLPDAVLQVTDESVDAAVSALQGGVDKVFFTGSGVSGCAVLHQAAETLTPVVAELSGCDAVFVLPGADLVRVVEALSFGVRLNGSATCMAPRRLMLIGTGHETLLLRLRDRFAAMDPVPLVPEVLQQLQLLLTDAKRKGATILGGIQAGQVAPVLVLNARSDMQVTRADLFAPVLSILRFAEAQEALQAEVDCPFGLTAAVFGPEAEARRLSKNLKVGSVLINDLIVPTADPRVPFGGRRASGFGVTRGAEGLLEMTAPRTVLVRRTRDRRHYEATGPAHAELFRGVLALTHGRSWKAKLTGLQIMFGAVRGMRSTGNRKFGSKV